MSDLEQLRRSWIANADAWSEAVRKRLIPSRRLATDAAVVRTVLDQNPRTLLDLGCGEGWLSRELAAHGIDVTGIDGSTPLIEAAREIGGATFVVMSYEEIAHKHGTFDARFDVIVANFSLLDDRAGALLPELRPMLTATGSLVVQTVHPAFSAGEAAYADGWRTETFANVPGEWKESMPWFFRTLESWSRLFRESGYAIHEIREPLNPESGLPASIIFICRPR